MYNVKSDLIEAAVNALGRKHPILYCTWRKNPEERRVSDGSAAADPESEGNREVFAAQHQDRKASGTISTYFRGTDGAIMIRNRKLREDGGGWVGGSFCDSDVHTVKRNPWQASFKP